MRMKQFFVLPLLALTACATLTAESDQTITITTTPPGASCLLSNSENTVTLDQTPGGAIVKRAYEPLSITCSKPGVGKASTMLEAATRGRAYGNILLLGVPALVDAHTGAGYEYQPDSVALKLTHDK